MTSSQTLLRRLSSLSVPGPVLTRIISQIDVWNHANGHEWTVKRLKDVKLFVLHDLAGTKYVPTTWWKRGCLSGPFSYFMKTSQKDLGRTLQCLMMYSAYKANQATPTQLKKFIESVVSPSPTLEAWPPRYKEVIRSLRKFDNRLPRSFAEYPLSLKGTTLEGGISIKESNLSVRRLDEGLYYCRPLRQLLHKARNPVIQAVCEHLDNDTWEINPTRSSNIIGRVHYIQEPGYKLRAIAIPHFLIQKAVTPLGDWLFATLRTLPWDCTFDQRAGALWAQQRLNDGKTLYSIDLSDATNNWPLLIQEELLIQAGVSESYLQVIDIACRGEYLLPSGEIVRWTKGQPLGLYPSFALFAASHGCLLRSLEIELGINDCFKVLGDDVIICDSRLMGKYRSWLNKLGVPVSEQKSFSSRTMAEFAGLTILKDRILSTPKWREITEENVLDFLRSFGPKGLRLVPRKWREPLRRIAEVPEPFGLGWNPMGKPLSERLSPELALQLCTPSTTRLSNKPNWAAEDIARTSLRLSFLFQEMMNPDSEGTGFLQSAEVQETDQVPLLSQESVLREFIPEAGVTRQELLGGSPPPSIRGQRAGDPRGSKESFWALFLRWFGAS